MKDYSVALIKLALSYTTTTISFSYFLLERLFWRLSYLLFLEMYAHGE